MCHFTGMSLSDKFQEVVVGTPQTHTWHQVRLRKHGANLSVHQQGMAINVHSLVKKEYAAGERNLGACVLSG